ncbi:MAG: type II secretion system F family protein [Nanoarchaeota archaeon]|jgi:flagellar protein FlaJ|nr:type II secretion system F family protein [Nanoarchaeota archaeon]
MEIQDKDLIGAAIGLGIIIASYFLAPDKYFPLLLGVGVMIGALPIIIKIVNDNRINTEKEEMFLEFARNLVESVKTGTPVSKSIINVQDKDFGPLSPHVKKLANQIAIGIPMSQGLKNFSEDVHNSSIARSLTLIGQAERAGGDIGEILEAVAGAVNLSDKLKKERKSSVSTLVGQGYIIFLVFIVIILVLQFQILPMVSGLGDASGSLGLGGGGNTAPPEMQQSQVSNAFLYLILVQGFFTGLVIGKLAEGDVKAGVRHSFMLMFLSFIASTLANIFFGG